MNEEAKIEKAPRVFISYSHDSEAHSAWVLTLATHLRACEVDVVLDQWDLGPGDDVPKFMEMAVGESDRVLMICTESYVRKADEGKGGVGYEAMIVTGELVKDLGTNKFIPVIRQGGGEVVVPTSVCTRLYVNLSEGQNFETGLEQLVREIHDMPKARKPPLGKNPYLTVFTGATVTASVGEVKIEDAETAYLAGCEIASRGDFKAWRELVRKVKDPLSGRLNAWRKKYDGVGSMLIAELPGMVLDAATIYSPLMAVALAGVESSNSKFTNQGALLDEFLRPRDWNAAGLTVIGSVPDALVYTYQALHGATCLEIGELPLAIALSRMRVVPMYKCDGMILHRESDLMGWPESFNHTCTMAWDFLMTLSGKWPWLNRIFGTVDDYQAALSAYYMALNIQELAGILAAGNADALKNRDLRFTIPVSWMHLNSGVAQKAYRQLLRSHDQVRSVWRSLGVTDKAMADAWPAWMQHNHGWAANVYHHGYNGKPPISDLFEDIRPQAIQP